MDMFKARALEAEPGRLSSEFVNMQPRNRICIGQPHKEHSEKECNYFQHVS